MKKTIFSIICLVSIVISARADDSGIILSDMYDIYQTVEQFCGGISDRLSKISGVSKANTAISVVGTVASSGALYAGIKKAETDKKIEELQEQICQLGGCDIDKLDAMSDEEYVNTILPYFVEILSLSEQGKINALNEQKRIEIEKSKKLGNWRTGLLAGTVGTNVASAILSGLNRDQSDFKQQIVACNEAVWQLNLAYKKAISDGVSPIENPVLKTFETSVNYCGSINISDIDKIEKNMTAVMGTSIGGAVIGAIGTGTSIAANTDKIRNDDSEQGKKKEKALNTVSNISAGANVATGIIETGFNVSLITLIKKIMNQAEQCERTLL